MTFEKSKPLGTQPIAQGDDAIRANNDGIQAALDLEHEFVDATANEQTGRHKFLADTTINIGNMSPPPVNGSIAIDLDLSEEGSLVWFNDDGTGWVATEPGVTYLGRTDEQNIWPIVQLAPWEDLGTVSAIPIDYATSSAKYSVLANSSLTTIDPPTNFVAANTGTVVLELLSGTLSTILWGAGYEFARGVPPDFDESDAATNVFFITQMRGTVTPKFLVTSAAGVGRV